MASERDALLKTVLERNFEDMSRLHKRLTSEPALIAVAESTETKVQADLAFAVQQLTDQELVEANTYYDSPTGQKERSLAKSVVANFDRDKRVVQTAATGSVTALKQSMIETLLDLHEIPVTLKEMRSDLPLTSDDVRTVFKTAYDQLSEQELEDAIRFHSSPTGRKCLVAARAAGLNVSKCFGL
jgi:hypothetical protein